MSAKWRCHCGDLFQSIGALVSHQSEAARYGLWDAAGTLGDKFADVPARPETAESLAVDIARELYDRFVMGGWSPEEAHDYLRDILHGYAESRVKEARRDSEILRHGRIVKLARMRKMFVCSECGAMLSQGPHSPDRTCSAATPEDECKRCHRTMLIRDGEEPTEVCDHCAHEMLSEIFDVVPNYRPKSKQPKSRKRKKADK